MVGNLKETLDPEKNSSVFQYVEVIRNFLHELQNQNRKGSFVSRKTAPSGLFCMSGPVAHVDDDEDAAERTCPDKESRHLRTLSVEKLQPVVRPELDQFRAERPLPDVSISILPVKQEPVITCLWSDGCIYEGEWGAGSDQCTGRGKIFWPSGSVYEGDVMGGYLHGIGTYNGADGTTYKGGWVLNKKQGFGKKTYANGDTYEGSWKWDVPDGEGKYVWSNGSEYHGGWRGGMMYGHGVLSWENGDKYDGQWRNGLAEGQGVYMWADGSFFVGSWSRGMRCGEGKFYPLRSKCLDIKSTSNVLLDLRLSDVLGDEKSASPRQKVSSPSDVPQEFRMLGRGLSADFDMLLLTVGTDPGVNLSLDKVWHVDNASKGLFKAHEEGRVNGYAGEDKRRERASLSAQQSYLAIEPKRVGELICRGHRNYDLMLNLQLGIRYSVGKITPGHKRKLFPSDFGLKANLRVNFPREGSSLTPPHQSADFRWKDYCPLVFRHLRELFKIDAADYMLSICGNEGLREFSSPGKSGSVFYLSQDQLFMIKTLRKAEVKVLLRMLPRYYKHVRMYKGTLLTKFFGLYRIKVAGGQKVRFVVMGNVISTDSYIHRIYDLKGSSQGRFADKIVADDTTTFKDLDLDFAFHLDPSLRSSLLEQIFIDCKFLESERIMDYSLLLGLHFKSTHSSALCHESSSMIDLPLHDVVISRFVPNDGGFLEVELASKSSASTSPDEDGKNPGRWRPLTLASMGSAEVEPVFPANERDAKQLGVSIPVKALHRFQNDKENGHQESYDAVLYLGVIDILQEYDMGKKIEHAYKSFQFDSLSISAVDPTLYSKRFQHFMHQVFLSNT